VRDNRLRLAIVLLCLVGLGISAYLTYTHYAEIKPICTSGKSCETVQSSSYAKLAGIPVAVLGLAGYAAIVVASLLPGEPTRMLAAVAALVGLGFSLYLTYLELFKIHAVCQWCVASAVVLAMLAVVTGARLVLTPSPRA
jgi:uncharacterized membrane protein